jgi:hypothetical protein
MIIGIKDKITEENDSFKVGISLIKVNIKKNFIDGRINYKRSIVLN